MTAKAGYNPSMIWKSLLEGRKLLVQGLVWHIGNGKKVNLWKDARLPSTYGTKMYSPINNTLPAQASVSKLINTESNTSCWNGSLIDILTVFLLERKQP